MVRCLCLFLFLLTLAGSPLQAQQMQSPVMVAAQGQQDEVVDAKGKTEAEAAEASPTEADATPETAVSKVDQMGEAMALGMTETIDRLFRGYWKRELFGISLSRLLISLFLLMVTFVLSRLLRYLLQGRLVPLSKLTKTEVDDLVFASAVQPVALLIQALGVYGALLVLFNGILPPAMLGWMFRFALALAAAAIFWYLYRLIDVLDRYLQRLAARSDNDLDNAIVEVIRKSLKLFVVAIAAVTIGKYVMDWNIAALLTGAGIAGLAVAFAAQDTIANLFGTFMVLIDRPFRVGERVKIAGYDGPVESIGFRSTRIRTLDGNLVSIPNKTTADIVIENIGRRPHIKWVTVIGLVYDTPYAKMQRAVEILRELLANHEGMNEEFPPRVNFSEFAAYSLNITAIAWYHGKTQPVDWWEYQEWRENINFEIMRRFEEEGLEFAFPTQTVYLAHDSNRPLTVNTTRTGGTE